MRKDADTLILLGGTAEPTKKREYVISTDTWGAAIELPFSLTYAACVSLRMPGIVKGGYLHFIFSLLHF